MIGELASVEARIEAAKGYRTEQGWSSAITPPYVVLEAPGWDDSDEEGVCGPDGTLDAQFRVKAVNGTDAGARAMLAAIRADLSPLSRWTTLTVAGRSARVKFVRSEFVGVDESVTITNTNRHPSVGVDTYRVVSQPVA